MSDQKNKRDGTSVAWVIKFLEKQTHSNADNNLITFHIKKGSAGAACVTHPLDLIKVQLQTAQEKKISIPQLTARIGKKRA